ncbi:MAG: hypothetical protein GX950_03545 [Candidatus Diapherotrites archaeon]|uniref:DNA polymerase n=1 Tax=Candidatus Iainarchaeum sp. TaxID=3101447 RepID=A0A7K4C011_9ARCH|nr:hypothetical protein [Candidatus Diapherotrites archaeon]
MGTKKLIKKQNKKIALLLDASYEDIDGNSIIRLFINDGEKRYWVYDPNFSPYYYVGVNENEVSEKKAFFESFIFGEEEKFKIKKISEENKLKFAEKEKQNNSILKISFNLVSHLVQSRKYLNELRIEKFEYDIPYPKRYLIDKRLKPSGYIEFEVNEKNEIQTINDIELTETKIKSKIEQKNEQKTVEKIEQKIEPLNQKIEQIKPIIEPKIVSFDLETWVGEKFEIGLEPITFISIVKNKTTNKKEKQKRVLSYNTGEVKGLELFEDEKEIIKELTTELNDTDIIVTYNGDNFDFSYTKIRAKKNYTPFLINDEEVRIRRNGLDNAAKISGVQHIDSFQIIQFMERTGAINTVKLDLETVSEKVFGVKKEKVQPLEINDAYSSKDEEKLERVVDYNLKDSETALRIAQEFLPLFSEISKLTSQTLYDTTRNTTSQMVEDLLIKEAHLRKIIAPNKPRESVVKQRTMNPIKGAFVKEPTAGLHENIAVLDFASLYPSIIISHNISPDTLNCEHAECKKQNTNPDGTWFCLKEKGLFPEILETMMKKRLALKKEYKEKKQKGKDDKALYAKQWALKIILNSVYGYLGYPRARWYSRECASATTALGREYIKRTLQEAEKAKYKTLYSDTDSIFLQFVGQSEVDVFIFLDKINSKLPEGMELEFDGFYKRGIFVTKKEGGAAKKRYALIDKKNNLKIVGFEYVRRDWCNVAKETQRKVIELILNEGKTKEPVDYVRNVIKDLREGKVKKSELTIMTMLQRKPKDYVAIGPHVAAAMKAIERGKDLGVGSMLSYIITKPKKDKATISEKAELEEYVNEGDYDPNYYIENQLLPAVIKIMQELGYTKEDLLSGGKQTGLGNWM